MPSSNRGALLLASAVGDAYTRAAMHGMIRSQIWCPGKLFRAILSPGEFLHNSALGSL